MLPFWWVVIFGILYIASTLFFTIQGVAVWYCQGPTLAWTTPEALWSIWVVIIPVAITLWLGIIVWIAEKANQQANGQANRLTTRSNAGINSEPFYVAWIGVSLTIVACIGCVAAYHKHVAARAFVNLLWRTSVSPQQSFDAPTFVLFYGQNDTAYANFSVSISPKCFYPKYMAANNCSEAYQRVPSFHSATYGNLTGYWFRGTGVSLQDLSSKVLLNTFVNYNSAAIGSPDGGYNTISPQNPYLYYAVVDPTLSLDELKLALDCGVVVLSELPALGSNTLTLTPYAVKDTLNALKLDNVTGLSLYANRTHLYYDSQLASTGLMNSAACDTSSPTYNSSHDCISQTILRFGTQYVTTFESYREKDRYQILIDEAAIVGGISFVFWYLTIFSIG